MVQTTLWRLRVIGNLPEASLAGGVHCKADYALIARSDGTINREAEADLDQNVHQLLQRCWEKSIKLSKEKCQLHCTSLPFIGHMVTDRGLQADPEKIQAIQSMSPPGDIKAFRRLIGFITTSPNSCRGCLML